jgi:membrane protease YdiL (CAAX protease family)
MAAVTMWLRSLSRRAEFMLVTGVAFGVLIVSAARHLARGTTTVTLSTSAAVALCAYEACALVVIGAILTIRGWKWRTLELRPTVRNTFAGCGVFLGAYVTYWLALVAAKLVTGGWEFAGTVRFERTAPLWLTVLLSAINPVFEEGIVVGYVVRFLERDGALFAICVSALIRVLYHVYQGSTAAVSILPVGIFFAAVFWRSRDLWRLIVAHAAMDFLALMAVGASS